MTELPKDKAPIALDPYNPWMTPFGVSVKRQFYKGKLMGKVGAMAIGVIDWLAPTLSRKALGAKAQPYPITTAQWILSQPIIEHPKTCLAELMACASTDDHHGSSWGLGFPWMSKNGLYDSNMPFVTHTPYALEALIKLMAYEETADEAKQVFANAWPFLENLLVMHEDDEQLALSYAPTEEPRIVINANSYAALSYALFASQNLNTEYAKQKAIKLTQWVLNLQQDNGAWYYYADSQTGNFIDCFHSCFVIKNLIKVAKLIPELESKIQPVIERGLGYLESHFFDPSKGLVKRFSERDIKDPFVWDLYDQAEYLGLLLLTKQKERAIALNKTIEKTFYHRGAWYCKTDIFGRRWGRNFLRWGIYPYFYQRSQLALSLAQDAA